MKYLLGVDFGGSSSKATLLSQEGDVVCTSSREYPTFFPQNGWSEQDPDDSYRAFVANVREILAVSGVNAADIVAMSLDAATHTAVLLDAGDRVIRNSIYWTDRRSTDVCRWLSEHHQAAIVEETLNYPGPLWTLPHLLWLRRYEPEHFSRIHRVLFMKDYVRYRLTGDFVTDSIEAMGSMMMDVRHECWSPRLCELCGLPLSAFPKIVQPLTIVSPLTAEACAVTGLTPGTAVLAGTTDTVMEVFAAGAIHPGDATVKLATAGRICPITTEGYAHPLLVNYRHVVPGLWYPGTTTKSCAASYRWYRDVFCQEEAAAGRAAGANAYTMMSGEATKVEAGSGGLFFHPYLQGELTPYLDDSLRGSFTGITSYHKKGHFSRAVLEGVAYSLKDCLQTLEELGIPIEKARIIGGGSASPLWCQITADILGIPLTKLAGNDSSLGSAMLAGIAAGIFSSFDQCVARCVRTEKTYRPDPNQAELYRRGFRTYRAIHDALAPIYGGMADGEGGVSPQEG